VCADMLLGAILSLSLQAPAFRAPAFQAPASEAARVGLRRTVHMAEGGPPQIDWQPATVVSNDMIARGTRQLRLKAGAKVEYKPGHILGFEVTHPETGEGLKGPYTVTRSVSADEFDIIYRVIPDGRKTPFMEQLSPAETVRFGGRFGTPVDEGVGSDCDRFVGIATGAGLGPLLGYAEDALAAPDGPECIELYCGFRDLSDNCGKACDALAAKYPDRFAWKPVISKPMACTAVGLAGLAGGGIASTLAGDAAPTGAASVASAIAPPPAASPAFAQGRVSAAVPSLLGDVISATTHFHLVGNGQFVVDWQKGLVDGGVDEKRVTTEKYFNGKAAPDEDVAAFIADAVGKRVAGRERV